MAVVDPKLIKKYRDEMDFLNSITNIISGRSGFGSPVKAYNLLKQIKDGSACSFKIRTVKICLILDDDQRMHKDIDFKGL